MDTRAILSFVVNRDPLVSNRSSNQSAKWIGIVRPPRPVSNSVVSILVSRERPFAPATPSAESSSTDPSVSVPKDSSVILKFNVAQPVAQLIPSVEPMRPASTVNVRARAPSRLAEPMRIVRSHSIAPSVSARIASSAILTRDVVNLNVKSMKIVHQNSLAERRTVAILATVHLELVVPSSITFPDVSVHLDSSENLTHLEDVIFLVSCLF